MSDWQRFLEETGGKANNALNTMTHRPGEVMICFVNRYLEGLDGIKYRIQYDGRMVEAQTTAEKYWVTISPTTFNPIQTFVWSRMNKAYKKLDDVEPNVASKKLVRKVLNTLKVKGKTEQHANITTIAPAPTRPAPAPTAGPSPIGNQGVTPVLKKDESGLPQTNVERPVPEKITATQLKKIFPAATDAHLMKIADELNKDLPKFKLDTPVRRAHFFGQIRQESGSDAKGGEESFKYTPSRLIATFGYYKKHPAEAQQDGRIVKIVSEPTSIYAKMGGGKSKKNKRLHQVTKIIREAKEEVIANKVYGEKGQGDKLGNEEPNDGWRYRGRGLKQTTGKDNFDTFNREHLKYWGDNINFVENSDLVAQFPYNVRSAVVFWLTKKCWKIADQGINDSIVDSVTKIVNNGEIMNHLAGKYEKGKSPVINRRIYTRLAYSAFA